METRIQRGFRVIRGPDWLYKNQDGGRGHAGTVVKLQATCRPYFPKFTVLVQWDNGCKGLYRVGHDQAFDLRVFGHETTKSGRHTKIWCEGCNVTEIKGIRWRCTECYAYDLCTTCYMNGKHDLSHVFTRVLSSRKTSNGPKMLPRSSASLIPLRGNYPGARVVRVPQWYEGAESDVQLGEVIPNSQMSEDSQNPQAMVDFSSERLPQVVDVTKVMCMQPGFGGHVYEGHLPCLGDLELVNTGDKILVTASPPEVEKLHKQRGLWVPDIIKACGRTGCVNRRTDLGNFEVTLNPSQDTFIMNPVALRKLHRLSLGQLVCINDDLEMVKRLQFGHGAWVPTMKQALGKVGRVVRIKELDVRVKVEKVGTFVFNLANLTPARVPFPAPNEDSMEATMHSIASMMGRPQTILTMAIAAGDITAARQMLKQYPDWVNFEPAPGKSLLKLADDLDMVKLLVENGAYIECYDSAGCTPLFTATERNEFEIVRYLLEQGADVDAANCEGITSFGLACARGSFESAHYLLIHGADVNIKARNDFTPLIHAIENEGRTILDLILARKELDLKAVSSSIYMTGMHYAALGGNTYALTKLMEKAPKMVEATQCNGNTPIFCAGYCGSLEATELLLKKGRCNVNATTNEDHTSPLHLATYKHNFHMIEVLMKYGADANIATRHGDTCLQMAINEVEEIEAEGESIEEEPYMAEMKKKWGYLGIKTNADALLAYLVAHGGDLDAYNAENITIRESLQLTSKHALLSALDEIQTLSRKDTAEPQSSSNRPLRSMTRNYPRTKAKSKPACSIEEKSNSTLEMPSMAKLGVYSTQAQREQMPKSASEQSSSISGQPTTQKSPSSCKNPSTDSDAESSFRDSLCLHCLLEQSPRSASEQSSSTSSQPKMHNPSSSNKKSSTNPTRANATKQSPGNCSGNSSTSETKGWGARFFGSACDQLNEKYMPKNCVRKGAKMYSGRNSAERRSASSIPSQTKEQKPKSATEKPSPKTAKRSTVVAGSVKMPRSGTKSGSMTKTQTSDEKPAANSTSQQKAAGEKSAKVCWEAGGDNGPQTTSSEGELHRLQAELRQKEDDLKVLRSKIKTLEHFVKKKILFSCGHDVIRSIADLIPECPNCSEPIASVSDA